METGTRTFDIHVCLGRGGFGEVYRATMRSAGGLSREVAVKTLRAGVSDPEAVARLRDEARLLAALNHPAIPAVYDLAMIAGRVALVTEYVPGADLTDFIRTGSSLPARAALEMVGEVASALAAAYNTPITGSDQPMRLIHRDIKPSNIRLTEAGHVKLLDFGIARSPEVTREAKTETGLVIGTFGYLAPDRITNEEVTAASDVYALGCVLYEALCSRRLFGHVRRSEMFGMALDKEKHDGFIDTKIGELGAAAPRSVRELLWRLLAWDPNERGTASEVSREAERLAPKLNSTSFKAWARQTSWPQLPVTPGVLDGMQVDDTLTFGLRPDTNAGFRMALVAIVATFVGAAALAVVLALSWVAWTSTDGESSFASLDADRPGEVAEPQPEPGPPQADDVQSADVADPVEVVQPLPSPEPEAVPTPAPRPPPEPVVSPAAPSPAGRFELKGRVPAELRRNGERHPAGRVPTGSYELWADFGPGFSEVSQVRVGSGETVVVKCSGVTLNCSVN